MAIDTLVLAVLVGYILGSISFTRVISRMVDPNFNPEEVDLPVIGSDETYRMGSMGATTASIKLGGKVGCAIGWLDIIKVTLPTLIFRLLYPDHPYFLLVATMGVVGHNWPIFYRFKGGRGISAIYGGMFVIDWVGALACAMGGLALGLFIVKDVIVAYISGAWLLIPWLWFRTHDPAHLGYALVVNILFMISMIPDIRAHLQTRKGGTDEMKQIMTMMPMGRGMLKMMDFFHLKKEDKA